MKTIIKFIVLIFMLSPILLVAQEYSEEQLMLADHEWYLTKLAIDDEEHPFIPNSLVGSSVLDVMLDVPYWNETINILFFYYCSGDSTTLTFVGPQNFEVEGSWGGLAYDDCMGFFDNPDQGAAIEYWLMYRHDFWGESNGEHPYGPFRFAITESEGGHFSLVITNPAGNKAYFGDEPLSVPAIEKEKISLYPNPALDHIYIDGLTGEGQIMIYDLNGKQLLYNIWSQSEEKIDISSLESGMYIYRLNLNGKESYKTGKLIVR